MKNPLAAAAAVAALALAAPCAAQTYEARAAQLGRPVADLQYAILHALLGWNGGSNPSFAAYAARDQALLHSTGVEVRPLARTGRDAPERAWLEDALLEVRRERNNGLPSHYNAGRPISEAQMIQRHKRLIARYAGRVFVTSVPDDADLRDLAGAAGRQDRLVGGLSRALKRMWSAGDDASFSSALASFNEAAAAFGKGYRLVRTPGETPAKVYEAARAIWSKEEAAGSLLARRLSSAGYVRAGLGEEADLLKTRYDKFWNGEGGRPRGFGGGGSAVPSAEPAAGPAPEQGSAVNAPALRADVAVPAPAQGRRKAPAGERTAQAPGLFRLLGTLFAGLFRTIARVVVAAAKGVAGVVKAALS